MSMTKIRQSQVKGLNETFKKLYDQIETYKPPVNLINDLPLDGNLDGDIRVCLEDKNIYIWNEEDQKWNYNSNKNFAILIKEKKVEILQNGQTTINTGIRFDKTGYFQTNIESILLYLNGSLQSSDIYTLSRVNEELIINWTIDVELLVDDDINVLYYDTNFLDTESGSIEIKSYLTSIKEDSLIHDEQRDLYYADINYNLDTTNIDVDVRNVMGESCMFSTLPISSDTVRIILMFREFVSVKVIGING